MADTGQRCHACHLTKSMNQFQSRNGSRVLKTCRECRDQKLTDKRNRREASRRFLHEEPRLPSFMGPAAVSPHFSVPYRSPTSSSFHSERYPFVDGASILRAGQSPHTPDQLPRQFESPNLQWRAPGVGQFGLPTTPSPGYPIEVPIQYQTPSRGSLWPHGIRDRSSTPHHTTFDRALASTPRPPSTPGLPLSTRRPLISNYFICNTCHNPMVLNRSIAPGIDICQYCQEMSIPFEGQG